MFSSRLLALPPTQGHACEWQDCPGKETLFLPVLLDRRE